MYGHHIDALLGGFMSNVQLGSERTPHDLSHFVFSCGEMGCLKVLSHTHVLAGDSFELEALGAFRLSPLRRGLAVDSKVELFTFYVPNRYAYGNDVWEQFLMDGIESSPLPDLTEAKGTSHANTLGIFKSYVSSDATYVPYNLWSAYVDIWNRYFRVPTEDKLLKDSSDWLDAFDTDRNNSGFPCAHMKTIWSAPLNDLTITGYSVDVGDSSVDLMDLNREYANLHTIQERQQFMQYYADVVQSFGGTASRDSENRPHLLMHTEFWASGYDVDGTTDTSLGQFSGRVQQSWKHEVPRYFVPEHGIIVTLALARFPPTMIAERDYMDVLYSGSATYEQVAGDSAIVANMPPVSLATTNFIKGSYDETNITLAHSQWLRYQRSHVDAKYSELEGFPFIDPSISPAGWPIRYVYPGTYDSCFQTQQLNHWSVQSKFNVNVLRDLPLARDSIMTS